MQAAQPQPVGIVAADAKLAATDAGRKRAGIWQGSDLDLDHFRNSKRYRQQEFARDLNGIHLAAAAGGAAAAAAAAAAATGPSPDPPDSPMLSVEGSPISGVRQQSQPPAPMQCTPRSESRTPSVHAAPGTGGGGQPTVHSSDPRRSRLAVGQTPVRLYDALNLQPTSPSDPGLEGELDLRKVTLMRRLQTRLLRADGDEAGSSSLPSSAAAAAAPDPRQQQARRQQQQQARRQQQQQRQQQQHTQQPAGQQQHAQQQQQGFLSRAQAAAAHDAAAGACGTSPPAGLPGPAACMSGLHSMQQGQMAGTPQRPQQRSFPELEDGGGCSAMQISPMGPVLH